MGIHPDVTPREIVAALHRQIAARSPEHAALVAEYRRLGLERPRAVPGDGREAGGYARGAHVSAACRERMRQFAALAASMGTEQAAARLGIHISTARRYVREGYLAGGMDTKGKR